MRFHCGIQNADTSRNTFLVQVKYQGYWTADHQISAKNAKILMSDGESNGLDHKQKDLEKRPTCNLGHMG